jgi:mannose-1-phosphate guanylyltransferase
MTLTHALILTAGLGTRLHPLTMVRAKPAIPVAGEPMVRRIARWLAASGVTDIVCNLHHRPETIAGVMGDGSDLGVRVRYGWEQPTVLGSAGGPRQALSIVGAETFLLVNGDTLTDLEVTSLADAHHRTGARVTLALVPNREPHRYGGVRIDASGRVIGFTRRGDAEGSWHFIGVQAVNADVFHALPLGQPASSVGGVYDALIEHEPDSVRGFTCDAPFWDVGTVSDYWTTSWALIDAKANGAGGRGERVRIDSTAHVSHSIVWDDIEISSHAALEDCIVTDGVSVPAGATYCRSILLSGLNGELTAWPLIL